MRKVGAYVFVAAVVLAVAAAVAIQEATATSVEDDTSEASISSAIQSQPEQGVDNPDLQVGGDFATSERPFVGIVVHTIQSEEAMELGIDGGARVARVLDDSPAAGLLHTDDIIIAIDGNSQASASDVAHTVGGSAPGDVLTFTVVRGDETLDVQVTVGEREFPHRSRPHVPDVLHGVLGRLKGLHNLVRAEIVVDTAEGIKKYRIATGNPQNIDVENGTFELVLEDGSSPTTYEISSETVVNIQHKGDLGGLEAGQRTLVVDVDGDVKLVLQGNQTLKHRFGGRHFKDPEARFHGPGAPGRQHFKRYFRSFERLPELRERLERTLPSITIEEFESGQNIREFLEDRPFERVRSALAGPLSDA